MWSFCINVLCVAMVHVFSSQLCALFPSFGGGTPAAPQQDPKALFDKCFSPKFSHVTLGEVNAPCLVLLFIEPYCAFCHESFKNAQEYVKKHRNIKVIAHYFPIYGQFSYKAACAILAGHKAGKHQHFHQELQKRTLKKMKFLDESDLLQIASDASLDREKFKAAMLSEEIASTIRETLELVQIFKIDATPTTILFRKKGLPPEVSEGQVPLQEVFAQKA
jgi:protein-disulfide isomerase